MMGLLIGLLTAVMVVDCLILIFLVLIQLPKKDAGAGLAFGAGATDALFGAGSGTVLTKITKYAASAFFAMAIILSVMQSSYHRRAGSRLIEDLERGGSAPVTLPQTDNSARRPTLSTNASLENVTNALSQPAPESTNLGAPTTNAIVLPTNSSGGDTTPK